jgi:hypothetical protein
MNDGDQYFEKKIIFMSKNLRNVVSADSSSPEVVWRGGMGTRVVNSSSPEVVPIYEEWALVLILAHTWIFLSSIRPFSMSVKGPPKTHFSGTF